MKISDVKMDIGPDGSLCRITSTAKDYVNNIQIVKLSEEEKSDGPAYKLVLIGEETNDSESEKSDEEIFEAEIPKDKIDELRVENIEENKAVIAEETVQKVKTNKNFTKKPFRKQYRPNYRQQSHKNYNSIDTRNFKSAGNVTTTYNRSVTNTSANDIDPWLNPPVFGIYPQYPVPPVIEMLNSSLASNSDKPVGLLGDSPYSPPFPHQSFQSNNQSNHFVRGQNYCYEEYSNNYQRPIHDTPVSNQGVHKKYYQNKHWENGRQKSSWKRNQNRNKNQKGQGKNNRHFTTESRRFL